MQASLYVHFPFCRSKCIYCDFCSFAANENRIEAYCASLMREMELASAEFADTEIATVYFGGGTPSIVLAPLMRNVTGKLRECFKIPSGIEYSSEANPGTLTDAWLDTMTKAGINRLSLGIQAKQERLLKLLGRIHTFKLAEEALQMARRHGINNLSVDLMYGLPTQTLQEYLDSIRAAADLGVRHISAYALKVEAGTRLERMIAVGELPQPNEDLAADMMDAGVELLERLGYKRYEISNFAQPGFESRHNLVYWRQGYYLGLGLNAASMLPQKDAVYVRRTNIATFAEYQKVISKGMLPISETIPVTREEAMFETIMLGLRTTDGVSVADFQRMHGVNPKDLYNDAIAELNKKGWLQPVNPAEPHLALNNRGLAMQNAALMPFMDKNPGCRQ